MPNTATMKVVVDNKTVVSDNGVLKLKISAMANNGLSFDANGKLIATPGGGTPVPGSIYNTPGNAIAPADASPSTELTVVGLSSNVSRHQKYTGDSQFVRDNEGVVMTKLSGDTLTNDCVAYYMIHTT